MKIHTLVSWYFGVAVRAEEELWRSHGQDHRASGSAALHLRDQAEAGHVDSVGEKGRFSRNIEKSRRR